MKIRGISLKSNVVQRKITPGKLKTLLLYILNKCKSQSEQDNSVIEDLKQIPQPVVKISRYFEIQKSKTVKSLAKENSLLQRRYFLKDVNGMFDPNFVSVPYGSTNEQQLCSLDELDSDIFNVDFSNLSPMSVIEENDFIQDMINSGMEFPTQCDGTEENDFIRDMINSGMEFPTQCDGTTIEQEVSQKESKKSASWNDENEIIFCKFCDKIFRLDQYDNHFEVHLTKCTICHQQFLKEQYRPLCNQFLKNIECTIVDCPNLHEYDIETHYNLCVKMQQEKIAQLSID